MAGFFACRQNVVRHWTHARRQGRQRRLDDVQDGTLRRDPLRNPACRDRVLTLWDSFLKGAGSDDEQFTSITCDCEPPHRCYTTIGILGAPSTSRCFCLPVPWTVRRRRSRRSLTLQHHSLVLHMLEGEKRVPWRENDCKSNSWRIKVGNSQRPKLPGKLQCFQGW